MGKMLKADYGGLVLQNFWRQRQRNVLAIVAILIGTASITLALALITGARSFYMGQFEQTGQLQQVIVTPQQGLTYEEAQVTSGCDNCQELTPEVVNTIKGYPGVVGVAPTANVPVFETISLDGNTEQVSRVQAYQPNGVIQHNIIAGSELASSDGQGKLVIGRAYADAWGYKGKYGELVGKAVTLNTAQNYTGVGATLADPATLFKKCQTTCSAEDVTSQLKQTELKAVIVGVESDEPYSMFVPLAWGTLLLQNRSYQITPEAQVAYVKAYTAWNQRGRVGVEPVPEFTEVSTSLIEQNGYSSLIVKAADEDQTGALVVDIAKLGFGAVDAQAYIQEQLEVFGVITLILGGMGGIALVVAAIGVINVMVMAMLERTREIGVMRAVGARRSTISKLFTLEAALLGFIGGAAGVLVGYGLITVANIFINIQLAENGLTIRNIIEPSVLLIVGVIVVATLVGTLAGLYPARRAARLKPVEALRHD